MSGRLKKTKACSMKIMTTGALTGEIRRATSSDSRRLHEIRRAAILMLAPAGMPDQMARQWADARSHEWIEQILRERAVWVFDCATCVVGWISVSGSEID